MPKEKSKLTLCRWKAEPQTQKRWGRGWMGTCRGRSPLATAIVGPVWNWNLDDVLRLFWFIPEEVTPELPYTSGEPWSSPSRDGLQNSAAAVIADTGVVQSRNRSEPSTPSSSSTSPPPPMAQTRVNKRPGGRKGRDSGEPGKQVRAMQRA